MKLLTRTFLILAALLINAGTALSQQPPDSVTGDTYQNTAMGSGALFDLTPSHTGPLGSGNTAAGYEALFSTTTGDGNSALGLYALVDNTTGSYNTAMGGYALESNLSGASNTASGYASLQGNTTGQENAAFGAGTLNANTAGSYNTAAGFDALYSNQKGNYNTAAGYWALIANTSGSHNTATGTYTLNSNLSGNSNTASGSNALASNTSADYNTADGASALAYNTTGNSNAAIGYAALYSNATGNYNLAAGYQALYSSTGASENIAFGYNALYKDTSGAGNTATGVGALYDNLAGAYNAAYGFQAGGQGNGSYNIGIGYQGGYAVQTGSYNIDIGSAGSANDNKTIRIGTQGTQAAAFMAGIYGNAMSGSTVVVTSTGQLGVLSSSERFKTDITAMSDETAKLERLRPVTFHLKSEPDGALQYGLIAEEVAKVYPDLVIRAQNGQIDGVRYDELAPMLLNEMQQEQQAARALAAAQEAHARAQDVKIEKLERQLLALQAAMSRAQRNGALVAGR
jgi:trimeric autotransporter adhesin